MVWNQCQNWVGVYFGRGWFWDNSEGGFKTEGASSEGGLKTEGPPSEGGFRTEGTPSEGAPSAFFWH